MYHHLVSKDLAKHLYSIGFKSLNEYDTDGRTPLIAMVCQPKFMWPYLSEEDKADLAALFLHQGADILRCYKGQVHNVNALHIAAFSGTVRLRDLNPREQQRSLSKLAGDILQKQWIDPIVSHAMARPTSDPNDLQVLRPYLLLLIAKADCTCYDRCCCGCCQHGCSQTTAFLKGITQGLKLQAALGANVSSSLRDLSALV